jgi:hypothetical protein
MNGLSGHGIGKAHRLVVSPGTIGRGF